LRIDPDALCPACGRPEVRLRFRSARFRFYACVECAIVHLWPQLAENGAREHCVGRILDVARVAGLESRWFALARTAGAR
jgi:hypothetical protein